MDVPIPPAGMYREEEGRDGILEKEGKMEYFED
jgi:hypothetical protein